MKKLKIIIGIILGVLLISGISVYATATYLAQDIGYTRSGTSVANVAEALNDLYNKVGNKTIFNGVAGYEYCNAFYYNFNSIDVDSNYIKSSTGDTTEDNNSLTVSFTIKKACNIRIQIDEATRGIRPSVIGEVKKNGTTVSGLSSISVEEDDVITIYFNNTATGNGNDGGGAFPIHVEKLDSKDDLRFITGTNNSESGVEQITIDRDCDNAIIVTGQASLEYAINQTTTFSQVSDLGANNNGMGCYYSANVSLKKGDTIYIRRNTTWAFGYIIIY